jgi:hypothetical protein
MWAGQGVALARTSQPAADIVTELTSRLPGRITPALAAYDSVAGLAGALRRAEAAHAKHEQETGRPDPDWPDWYARHMADESAAGQAAGSRAPTMSSS